MTHINQRRDTAANWTSANPVLQLGEVGWERDTRKAKLGDGITTWNSLTYAISPPQDLSLYAPLASPTLTGDPKAPTPATADNDTSIATTAFVKAQGYAPAASPTLTGDPKAPTPVTADNDTSIATTAFVKAVLLAAHPIGDIKFSVVNVNPGTYLGGTWVAWGSGRVPVGVDTGQTEFDTVEETGGAKAVTLTAAQIPAHTHPAANGTDSLVQAGAGTPANVTTGGGGYGMAGTGANTGGGQAHSNLQPYITCYMFKRTA